MCVGMVSVCVYWETIEIRAQSSLKISTTTEHHTLYTEKLKRYD